MKNVPSAVPFVNKDGVLYESGVGGMHKIRCPKCQGNSAIPVQQSDGTEILQCGCGAKWKLTAF